MADQDIDLTETNGAALVGTAIVFLVLSWISVALRTYTRAVVMTGFQLDDWLMLIAQVGRPPLRASMLPSANLERAGHFHRVLRLYPSRREKWHRPAQRRHHRR